MIPTHNGRRKLRKDERTRLAREEMMKRRRQCENGGNGNGNGGSGSTSQ